ncbi:hypothetical protein Mal48_24010 [Thalassoglobus polymorphus]|uniref:Peptidase family M50 n=2 Tax=Thalassoglobus polymorphus TaxID=2527994 RepID=A0A517QND6_9PLAN|nr:hypothetical protein Mal48_24010 [Thalassoglobus polymorphus]
MPLLSWLLMQAVHELGHLLAALLTGGRIVELNLHPLSISHTIVHPNPAPLIVIWAGPIVGVLFPILLWILCKKLIPKRAHLLKFLVGFCLIANGLYLGSAVFDAVGDARDLLQRQVPLWGVVLFGAVTVPAGFLFWNGLGKEFGMGEAGSELSASEPLEVFALLVVLVVLECIYF